jgi:hypothetical protein
VTAPKTIRKVSKVGQDGLPKIAVDRKDDIQMERIRARVWRPCDAEACWFDGVIHAASEYARITSSRSKSFYAKGSQVRVPEDYHFECVPPYARPLLRFFGR